MELVSNQFLKYDVTNDGLLEEVGRFIEFGDQQLDSESIVEEVNIEAVNVARRKEQEGTGLVDQLLNKIELKQSDSRANLHRSQSFAPQASILKRSNSKKKTVGHNARFGK